MTSAFCIFIKSITTKGQFFRPEPMKLLCLPFCNSELLEVDVKSCPALGALP